MPVRVSPSEGRDKWANRTSAASQDYVKGVDKVTVSPSQQAAAKVDKWAANTQAAKDKFRRNAARVTVEQWKELTKNVGGARFAQGVQAKQGKYEAFAQDFYPHLDRGLAKVDAMPDTTFEDRLQKSVAMMRHNHEFKRSS